MKHSLTIAFLTSRDFPKVEWFLDSLGHQMRKGEDIQVLIVDLLGRRSAVEADWIKVVEPKPTPFQGPHRVTKDNWWAKSSSLNTAICLCTTEFIAFLDDRLVLGDQWLQAVRDAMEGNYAVCGAYSKHHNLVVDDGKITDFGTLTGSDGREAWCRENNLPTPRECEGDWWYGCSTALPLEWCLQINGANELLDSLSHEDVHFGLHLRNNNYPIKYDPRMRVYEDRTPGQCGPDMRRECKQRFANDTSDKGHTALKRFAKLLCAPHSLNVRALRERMQNGGAWPKDFPAVDWFDGMPLVDFDNIPR